MNLSDIQQFNSFILSGRRKSDRKINAVNSKIIKHAISEKKHLFGICYGAEILTQTLGGTIKNLANKLKATKQSLLKRKIKFAKTKLTYLKAIGMKYQN